MSLIRRLDHNSVECSRCHAVNFYPESAERENRDLRCQSCNERLVKNIHPTRAECGIVSEWPSDWAKNPAIRGRP